MPDQISKRFFLKEKRYLMPTFRRQSLLIEKARGSTVWDSSGRKYLDFVSGLGVCSIGHVNPDVLRALRDQSTQVWHVSNFYYTRPPVELAEQLSRRSFGAKVFLSNSGTEANECAVKLVRKWASLKSGSRRFEIVTFDNSFHGRTLAMVAAGQEKFQKGFEPMLAGFVQARFNDLSSVKKVIGPRTAAILVEPVQGEGGVHIATPEFLKGLRRLCDQNGLLLIFDEVQCGLGRTGKLFAYEHSGVKPDVLALAKGLAGGFPIGATLARPAVADVMTAGTHGSTFGGNALAARCGLAALNFLTPARLARIRALGNKISSVLEEIRNSHDFVREVRGTGLMWGLELDHEGGSYVLKAQERGLLINCTQGNVLRLLPPFVLTDAELERGLRIFRKVLSDKI
jgi:predicted acetylornithine/succinylornithine family transaminase